MIKDIILNLFTSDFICQLIAKFIGKLLNKASSKGGQTWERTKNIILKINTWTTLFLQVYDDDNMTQDEESKVAKAISEQTNLKNIIEIVKKPQ